MGTAEGALVRKKLVADSCDLSEGGGGDEPVRG